MFCPFHEKDVSKTSCNTQCPFYHKVETGYEECLLANSIVAIPAKLDNLYNMLEELTEGLLTIQKEFAEQLIRLSPNMKEAKQVERQGANTTAEEGTRKATGKGTRAKAKKGGDDGIRDGGVQEGVPPAGIPEGGSEES